MAGRTGRNTHYEQWKIAFDWAPGCCHHHLTLREFGPQEVTSAPGVSLLSHPQTHTDPSSWYPRQPGWREGIASHAMDPFLFGTRRRHLANDSGMFNLEIIRPYSFPSPWPRNESCESFSQHAIKASTRQTTIQRNLIVKRQCLKPIPATIMGPLKIKARRPPSRRRDEVFTNI